MPCRVPTPLAGVECIYCSTLGYMHMNKMLCCTPHTIGYLLFILSYGDIISSCKHVVSFIFLPSHGDTSCDLLFPGSNVQLF